MALKLFPLTAVLSAVLACTSNAAFLISEVLYNEVGSDVTGEWIEIFNTGPSTINLTNYKIGDEETSGGTTTTEAMHRFPAGASIAPGELQIVAVSATRFFAVYGILPTYEATSTNALVPDMLPYAAWDPDGGVLNMSNTTDHAYLLDGADAIIDRVSWGNNNAFNPGLNATVLDGQSYERKNSYFDTDTADDWQVVAGATAAARSTPFTANVPEPATFAIAFGLVLACGLQRRGIRNG